MGKSSDKIKTILEDGKYNEVCVLCGTKFKGPMGACSQECTLTLTMMYFNNHIENKDENGKTN